MYKAGTGPREVTVSSTLREWQEAVHASSKASLRTPEEEKALEEDLAIIALLHSDYSHLSEYASSGGDFELDLPEEPRARVSSIRTIVRSLHPGHIRMLAKVALLHEGLSKSSHCILQNDIQYRENESGKPSGFIVALADTLSRILDLCGHHALDLGMALLKVHQYRKTPVP